MKGFSGVFVPGVGVGASTSGDKAYLAGLSISVSYGVSATEAFNASKATVNGELDRIIGNISRMTYDYVGKPYDYQKDPGY